MDNLQRLTNVFSQVFQDSTITLTRETTSDDIEGWDSLSHVNLLIAIELEFDIEFHPSEIRKLNNVGDLLDLINKLYMG